MALPNSKSGGRARTVLHLARRDDTSGLFSQMARHLDAGQYRMRLATLEPLDAGLRAAMAAARVPHADFGARSKDLGDYLRIVPRLARYLRRHRVHALHSHFYYPALVGGMAGVLARTPVRVLTRHHADYHARLAGATGLGQGPGRLNRHVLLDRLSTRLYHRVIAISGATARQLLDWERAPEHKVVVVPNGIDFDDVRVSSPERVAELNREFGVGERDVLLVAARLAEEKGVDYFFRALPELRRRADRPFTVLHAGEGPLLESYQRELRALRVDDLVQFLGFRRDLPDLMAASDLLVVPSLSEAFGLVAAEALYLDLPVVATLVGGLPELVEDGVDGLLVPPANSAALAEAVLALLNNPGRRRQMAGAGHEKIAANFGFPKMMRGYEAVYADVARDRGLSR